MESVSMCGASRIQNHVLTLLYTLRQVKTQTREKGTCNMYANILENTVPVVAASASDMLANILSLISGGIQFLGCAMIVWGLVSIGINVQNGASGNGSAISQGIAMVVGGAVITAAGVYFSNLDTSWVTA